jgi:hypothetical protein
LQWITDVLVVVAVVVMRKWKERNQSVRDEKWQWAMLVMAGEQTDRM